MSNWLEDAERKKVLDDENASSEDRVQLRKAAILDNYQSNKELYDGFIAQMEELAIRVNDLPLDFRTSFGKLNYKYKESKLDNHLYYISSSRRIEKRLKKSIFTYFKKYSFKHIRVGYFTVSRNMGVMDIELKENLLLRVKMKTNGDDERTSSRRRKNDDRKDYVFRMNLNSVNEKTGMEIIDWLAFKKNMEDISFFSERDQSIS
jgi:hypothetical protein